MNSTELIPSGKLSKPQLDLLKMFSADIPDEDWLAIREYAKQYFAQKATEEMNKVFEEQNWDDAKITKLLNADLRSNLNK